MTSTSNGKKNLFVVGIASSAGGLQPLKQLIESAVCHKNMAFILVPHLDRERETALPKILKSITELKIEVITDHHEIKPCHLYVLPPGKYARVVEKEIVLDGRPENEKINHSADILFESLAKDYRDNAIGVVLSGAAGGSDGAKGVSLIKQAGGHTYAQTPSSAEFPQMPQAAIDTGFVDSVMAPDEIGHELSLVNWAL